MDGGRSVRNRSPTTPPLGAETSQELGVGFPAGRRGPQNERLHFQHPEVSAGGQRIRSLSSSVATQQPKTTSSQRNASEETHSLHGAQVRLESNLSAALISTARRIARDASDAAGSEQEETASETNSEIPDDSNSAQEMFLTEAAQNEFHSQQFLESALNADAAQQQDSQQDFQKDSQQDFQKDFQKDSQQILHGITAEKRRLRSSAFFNIFRKGDHQRSADSLSTETKSQQKSTHPTNKTNKSPIDPRGHVSLGSLYEPHASAHSMQSASSTGIVSGIAAPLSTSSSSSSTASAISTSVSAISTNDSFGTSVSPPPAPPLPQTISKNSAKTNTSKQDPFVRPRVRGHLKNSSFSRLTLVQELNASLKDNIAQNTSVSAASDSKTNDASAIVSALTNQRDASPSLSTLQTDGLSNNISTNAQPIPISSTFASAQSKSRRGNASKTTEDPGVPVWVLQFSHDGQYLASGSHDGTILVWSVLPMPSPIASSSQSIQQTGSERPFGVAASEPFDVDDNRSVSDAASAMSFAVDNSDTGSIQSGQSGPGVPGLIVHPPAGENSAFGDDFQIASDGMFGGSDASTLFFRGMRNVSGNSSSSHAVPKSPISQMHFVQQLQMQALKQIRSRILSNSSTNPAEAASISSFDSSGPNSAKTVSGWSGSGVRAPFLGRSGATGSRVGSATNASTSDDSTAATIPNVFDARPYRIFRGHARAITSIAWSRGGFLVSGSVDHTVHLWHINHADFLCVFHHNDCVTSVSFHPRDDRYFVSGSLDGRVRLWSISEKRVRYWNEIHQSPVTAVSFSRDGNTVVAGTMQGDCVFYETVGLKYHTQIQVAGGTSLKGPRDIKITGIVPMPIWMHEEDVGGSGASMEAAGSPSGETQSNFATNNAYLHRSDTDEKYLVTSTDSRVRLVAHRDKSIARKYKGVDLRTAHMSASFSDDAAFIVCASEDRQVVVWDALPPQARPWQSDMRRTPGVERFAASDAAVTAALFAPRAVSAPRLAAAVALQRRSLQPIAKNASHAWMSPAKKPSQQNPNQPEDQNPSEETPILVAHQNPADECIIVVADLRGRIRIFQNSPFMVVSDGSLSSHSIQEGNFVPSPSTSSSENTTSSANSNHPSPNSNAETNSSPKTQNSSPQTISPLSTPRLSRFRLGASKDKQSDSTQF